MTFSTFLWIQLLKYKFDISDKLSKEHKDDAASLCGTLLFSESHVLRNPTGGKLERKAMKDVLKLAENGRTNHFGVVFNRKNGRYISGYQHGMRAGKLIFQNNLTLVDIRLFIFNIIKTKLLTDNPNKNKISDIIKAYNKNADKKKQLINVNKIKGEDGPDKEKIFQNNKSIKRQILLWNKHFINLKLFF